MRYLMILHIYIFKYCKLLYSQDLFHWSSSFSLWVDVGGLNSYEETVPDA